MKKLSFIEKIVFSINSLAAVMLLLSYILPHVQPKSFALLSVLSLAVPFLIILNILFVVYWLLKVKKQLIDRQCEWPAERSSPDRDTWKDRWLRWRISHCAAGAWRVWPSRACPAPTSGVWHPVCARPTQSPARRP